MKISTTVDTNVNIYADGYEVDTEASYIANEIYESEEFLKEMNDELASYNMEIVVKDKPTNIWAMQTQEVQEIYDAIVNSHHWGHINK